MAGRPFSPETDRVREYLAQVPASQGVCVREVASELQIARCHAHRIVGRMVDRGEITEGRRDRVPDVKKPVCFYAAATEPLRDMFEVLRIGIVRLD